MTTAVVVDASAMLTLVLEQEGAIEVRRQIEAWQRAGTSLRVPSHFWLEVANTFARRRRLPASDAVELIHRFDELGLETVEISRPILLLAIDSAEQHGLSSYDAAYLALAETLDAPLYSADERLLRAAGDRAIPARASRHRVSDRPARYGGPSASTWPRYREISAYLATLRTRARDDAVLDR